MAIMTRLKHGIGHMDLHHGVDGVGGLLLESAVEFGTGYGIGQAYARYPDKWYGKHAPTLAAGIGKLGAGLLATFAPGSHIATGMLSSLGASGLAIKGCEMGLASGRKAKNIKTVVVPATAALPSGGQDTLMGAGAGGSGRGLTYDQIQELASMH